MKKTITFCGTLSDLGLSSSSTAQEVYDALNESVLAFCSELGFSVIESGLLTYAPYWLIGYEGNTEPLFFIATYNSSSYFYNWLIIAPTIYKSDSGTYSWSAGATTGDSYTHLCISMSSSYSVKVRYEIFQDGTIAFNFYLSSATSVQSKFILFDCAVGDVDYKVFVSCYSSGFAISAIKELGIGIDTLYTVAYDSNIVNQNYVFCKRYGEVILNVPLNMGAGIYLPEIFKMYTNRFSKAVGQLIFFKGRKFEIFNTIMGTMLADITEEEAAET